jgi:hypothetical protein
MSELKLHAHPSFRTEQADFFFPLRSCEAVGLRREKSLFLFRLVPQNRPARPGRNDRDAKAAQKPHPENRSVAPPKGVSRN